MAEPAQSADEEEDRSECDPDDEEPREEGAVVVSQAWVVKRQGSKKSWIPDYQCVSGMNFIHLSKWDRDLCYMVRGKAMQRHKNRQKSDLAVEWWSQTAKLRKEQCNVELRKVVKSAADDEGAQAKVKVRCARDDDGWLVQRCVLVEMPPLDEGGAPHAMRMLWQVKGLDAWIELNPANVTYCLRALRESPPEEAKEKKPKASPKRRRKLKRRLSDAPAGHPDAEEPNAGQPE